MTWRFKLLLCVLLIGVITQTQCWWVYQKKALQTSVIEPTDRVALDFFEHFDFSQEKENAIDYPVA